MALADGLLLVAYSDHRLWRGEIEGNLGSLGLCTEAEHVVAAGFDFDELGARLADSAGTS